MAQDDADHGAPAPASLIYETPPERAVEGLPIGNGTMGTLVWTTPEAVHLQLNRCDVYAVNKRHTGPASPPLQEPQPHVDWCGGCARPTHIRKRASSTRARCCT